MRLVLLLIAHIFLLTACTQKDLGTDEQTRTERVITDRLNAYLQLQSDGNWDDALDLVYPKIFDIAPRHMVMAAFRTLDDMGVEMRFEKWNLKQFSKTLHYEGEQFVSVRYYVVIHIGLSGELAGNAQLFAEVLVNEVGGARAEVIDDNNLRMNSNRTILAIAPEGSDSWTFIEDRHMDNDSFDQIVPSEIFDELEWDEE